MRVARALRAALVTGAALAAVGCDVRGSDEEAAERPSGGGPAAACRTTGSGAHISVARAFVVSRWRLERTNEYDATGCLTLDGKAVSGARIKVGNYVLPAPTDEEGRFRYPADATLPHRKAVRVADASAAKIDGSAASAAQRTELRGAQGFVVVRFRLNDLEATREQDGIRITGRATFADGTPPPRVVLYAYQLAGRVVDAQGRGVKDAIVSTRSLDREFWSLSPPSRADGSYESFFYPSASEEGEEVGFIVRIARGNETWEMNEGDVVFFRKLQSSRMEVRLPARGHALQPPTPQVEPGAIYEGLLVGVEVDGRSIKPLSARWVDAQGRFELVLPASLAGKTVRFWESELYSFSRTPARPGAPVDLAHWPRSIPSDAPRDLERLTLPG